MAGPFGRWSNSKQGCGAALVNSIVCVEADEYASHPPETHVRGRVHLHHRDGDPQRCGASRGGAQSQSIQGCGADPDPGGGEQIQIQGWGADPGVGADPGWEQIQGCGADPGVGRRSKGRGRVRSKGRSGADPGVWWQTQEADPDDKVDEGHLGVRVHHRDLAQDVQIQRERWLPRSLPRDTLRIEDLATNSQSSRGVRGHGHFCAQERNDGRALARPGIDRCHAAPSHSVAQQDERSADRPWRVQ